MTVMLSEDTINDNVKVDEMRREKLNRLVEELKLLIDQNAATPEQIRYRNYLTSILEP